MTYESALQALADPTRLRLFEHLQAGPLTVGALARTMPISRPAVSQHLKILKSAGLVFDRADGTKRIYAVDRQGLVDLRQWLERFWDDALVAFKAEVEA